ncbi:MAG: pyridoxamine 5'-phosphate oxidase [Pirellulaceae bacterium]
MDLGNVRKEYSRPSIDIDSLDPCAILQFEVWFGEAMDSIIVEPNAMVLSTVDSGGQPAQRTVLLKYFDQSGFVFFTNYESRKALHIEGNRHVSLLFPWYGLERQVEISGHAEKVSTAESLKYFALRPRGSQLAAWVSRQSSVVPTRSVLKNKLAEMKARFASGAIPMPTAWGGFRVRPSRIEFWQGGGNRLHDRIEYRRSDDQKSWLRQRLAP